VTATGEQLQAEKLRRNENKLELARANLAEARRYGGWARIEACERQVDDLLDERLELNPTLESEVDVERFRRGAA
jgi:hypothetical protein